MRGYLALLRRNPGFARLWYAQAVSLLGDWFSLIALSALVTRYGGENAGLAVSGLLLARFLPPLLIGPFAGVLVDRADRRQLLIISDAARVLIVLTLLLATDASRLPLVYILVILQSCFSALFEPARSAILPSLIAPEDLVQANVLGSVTWSVMLAAGAAIGGVVAATLGTPLALVIDAGSFALSAAFILSIPRRAVHERAVEVTTSAGIPNRRGLLDGLRYARAHPAVAASLLIKLGGSVGSIDALMIIYATQIFVVGKDGAGSLGLFYAFFGVGAVLGPALMQRVNNGTPERMRRFVIVGYACITVGWFLFGSAGALLLAAGALVVKAMGSSIYWTYSSAIIQKIVPDSYLGRMFSLDLAGFQLATVISTIVTGVATNGVYGDAVRPVVFATGFASMVPLAIWALLLRRIDRWEAAEPAPVIINDEPIEEPVPV